MSNSPLSSPWRLLIVDDHPIVLNGLRLLFEGGDGSFEVAGEAVSATDACEMADALEPDAIITDLVMGQGDGITLIEDLREKHPGVPILVYSSRDERVWGPLSLRAGASGFVSKACALEAVAHALLETLEARQADALQRPSFPVREQRGGCSDLSAREIQVLQLIGQGATLKSLALQLGLSVKTVGTYRERLKVKLGLDSVRTLERYAAAHVSGRREEV